MSTGLAGIVDADVEIMILGSFPSEKSLAAGQYYANPLNQFWRLVGAVISEPLHDIPYSDRITALLARRIGLWDVLSACDRDGSLDSAIRNARCNDFSTLRRLAPKLRRVCFSGKKAGKYEADFKAEGYETVVLPSSSPAHAIKFEEKLRNWKQLLSPSREAFHAR